VTVRTGELVVVAGGSAAGKSTFAVNLIMGIDIPTLYIAQDSPGSVKSRMVALATDTETHVAARRIINRPAEVREAITNIRPTLILEEGAVDLERIRQLILALTEWLGRPPPLIVLDNLIDLIVPGENFHSTSFYATALPQIKRLSLELNVCVMLLHHIIRGGREERRKSGGQGKIHMTDVMYAGDREARHVWGVYNNGRDEMRVQVLKQQDGPADPGGDLEVRLSWYPKLARLNTLS